MDEPFSSLDIAWRNDLYHLTKKLQQETGSGIILITHDIDEAIELADKILVLEPRSGDYHLYKHIQSKNKVNIRKELRTLIISKHEA